MAVATPPLAAPTTRPPKGWLATFVVAAVMVVIVGGGFVAQGAVANEPPKPVEINGVVLTPAEGWDFAGRSDDGTTILLTNGNGSLAITAFISGAELLCAECDPLVRKRDEWLKTGTVTATDPAPVTIGSRTLSRFQYTGTFDDVPTPVEGTVSEYRGARAPVLFDGWAGVGEYRSVTDDIDSMIGGATIP